MGVCAVPTDEHTHRQSRSGTVFLQVLFHARVFKAKNNYFKGKFGLIYREPAKLFNEVNEVLAKITTDVLFLVSDSQQEARKVLHSVSLRPDSTVYLLQDTRLKSKWVPNSVGQAFLEYTTHSTSALYRAVFIAFGVESSSWGNTQVN